MERALDTRCPTSLSLEQLVAVLVSSPEAVLDPVADDAAPPGLFVADLTVRLGEAQTVHQQVVVQLGEADVGTDEVRWPIVWHPASHERLLPEFAGSLVARRTGTTAELGLEGSYRPPLGRVGKFGDGVIGHRVARRSTTTFLEEVAARIATVVRPELGAVAGRTGSAP